MAIELIDFDLSTQEMRVLRKTAAQAVISLRLKDIEISIISIISQRIKNLNKLYRQQDVVTDVLSFRYEDEGEIFICLPQTKRQAKENKVTLREELQKLIVHGMAHLAGYDHIKTRDFQEMKKIEDRILNKVK
ncbi:MAG: rRNA maturation RNase YbeY [Parcubacteria group bacterium CG1_02_37_51]|uniref:Endoribonuclease YbeY n=2 Tax=Candidatus Komeiliibacteriota TaxID=1817908 RepID=A0A2M8DQ24_9BACT|nr:MAG: rRNA maturation RNase YbeY [Parcubacteria group bacterium CG1_02_37_51]PIY94236.1 MAG: rRNA maturation RNase YbeY [Candidatus Komeilibacteria bacterium CG_4_10_14_0_8_um_filter_37_78]PJC01001.1 MAG: rRNA maturation RNase YbeY [Candidatus Komeilibacteria bacterium CG_4_9_14_0_8_um_filter_36_9]